MIQLVFYIFSHPVTEKPVNRAAVGGIKQVEREMRVIKFRCLKALNKSFIYITYSVSSNEK